MARLRDPPNHLQRPIDGSDQVYLDHETERVSWIEKSAPSHLVYLGRDLVARDPCGGDADGGSTVLAAYPVEGLLLEYFVGGVPEERLGDLFPIAVLLIDHLGDRPDGLVAVHEPERLDAAFGETDSNGLADATAGAGDHGNLTFYVHKGFASSDTGFRLPRESAGMWLDFGCQLRQAQHARTEIMDRHALIRITRAP